LYLNSCLERTFEDEDDKDEGSSSKPKSSKQDKEDLIIPDSKLDPAVQEFARLIFNTRLASFTFCWIFSSNVGP